MDLLMNPTLWMETPVSTVAAAMREHGVRTIKLEAKKGDRPLLALILIHGEETQAILDALDEAEREMDGETFNLIDHIHRQQEFSLRTFGPGARAEGVVDHIRKELAEIEAAPLDLTEWVDVILLAIDGAWRAGFSPEEIAQAIADKQACNEARRWPDWRTVEPDKAIEHLGDA